MAADRFWDRAAETMPRDELERLQMARVRSCVARLLASGAAFYRQRLGPIAPDDLRSIEDLARLPFTTKNDLREQYPFGLLAAPSREIVRIHASSGSTGKPTVVAYTRADLALWANVLARGLVAGGLTSADVFQNAYGYGLFTGGLGFHDAASLVGAAVVPTSSGNTPRQVMLMRDFGVTAFAATPSYAINVAEVASAEGIDLASLPLRAAFVGAEPMSPAMQREIEERMGVRVYEQFGLSEIIGPGVASACAHQRGLHVWEDHFIPEIIDPEGGAHLPDGEVGELVLTAATKEAFSVHLIGMGAAREMMLLGETWDAARAHRQGLVGRVVPLERLEATALDLATKLAANVRAASVATKRLILRSHDLSLGRFLGEYVRSQRGCWNDRETRGTLARYRTGRWGR